MTPMTPMTPLLYKHDARAHRGLIQTGVMGVIMSCATALAPARRPIESIRSETPAGAVISPERAAMRKRWREILDLIADNPLKGDDAFLSSTAAARRPAKLADPEYRAQAARFPAIAGAAHLYPHWRTP